MSDPYMSEIRMMSFNYPPKNWAQCDGASIAINQNQALFSLLGTTFGGDGIRTFKLPDLRGRTPISFGASPGGTNYALGESGGEPTHALTLMEIPNHTHGVNATSAAATASDPSNLLPATTAYNAYAGLTGTQTMSTVTVQFTGSGAGHENMQPYLAVNFCICMFGIFPSRN